MTNYAARAAEAIEHQARYWRMLEDPLYRAWIEKQHDLQTRQISPEAGRNNELGDMVARVATGAGEPFWWSPQICQLLEVTYPSMPAYELSRENLPAPAGFFWFDRPINVDGGSHVKCIAWAQVLPYPDEPIRADGGIAPKEASARASTLQQAAAIMAVFFETTGEVRRVSKDPIKQRWEMPMASIFWSFGRNYQDQHASDLYSGGSPKGDYDGTAESRLFASCIAFLSQRILVSPRLEAPRKAQKRLARAKVGSEPFARVVALRKAFERLSGASESRGDPTAWSCQWIVGGRTGGFWRPYWLASKGVHEMRFVFPFTKGPSDKPFKPVSRVVHSVHR